MVDVAGNNVPSSISKDGWSAGGGAGGGECGAADEADTLSDAGAGGDKLEGTDSTQDDALHLERRVGLFSGVALIVGTMIGKCSLCKALYLGTYEGPTYMMGPRAKLQPVLVPNLEQLSL